MFSIDQKVLCIDGSIWPHTKGYRDLFMPISAGEVYTIMCFGVDKGGKQTVALQGGKKRSGSLIVYYSPLRFRAVDDNGLEVFHQMTKISEPV